MPSSENLLFNKYELNYFRKKKIRDKYLLIAYTGHWDALANEEYRRLMSHKLDETLYKRLSEKGLIITENNKEKLTNDFKKSKQQLFQGTSLHIVVVTLRCNESCVYCHAASRSISAKEYDMSIATARKTVDFIFQTTSNAITIEFQGGEPLLNFDTVKEIILYAKEKNKAAKKKLRFSIVTNLSLMDENKLDFLIENKIGICTSLDGPKILHDKNRPFHGQSSYEYAVKWIKKIKEKKGDINALMSTTRATLDYPTEIIDEYAKFGLNNIWLRFLNNLGCAKEQWDKLSYSADEFLSFWKKGVDYSFETGKINELSGNIILKKILLNENPMMLDFMSPCGAAIGQLAYNYDGNIYSCDEARMLNDDMFLLGNVTEDTYGKLMKAPKTCSLIASSVNECLLCDACAYQPFCGICPVCTYAANGTLLPKLSEDFRCRVFIGQFYHLFEKIIFEEGFAERIRKNMEQKHVDKR
ncbi:MAG: His-Xaa-Ser system radical SAM maturase HxsB [archaeon]